MVDVTRPGPSDHDASAAAVVSLGRRRPSGEAPPLPRHVSSSTQAFVALIAGVGALWVALMTVEGARVVTAVDLVGVRAVRELRTPLLDDVMRTVHALGSEWTIRLIAWPTFLVLLVTRRFYRLFALVVITLLVVSVDAAATVVVGRARPAGVEILASWVGYANPSLPVAMLGMSMIGAAYTLVPAGRWRTRAVVPLVAAVAALGLARVYLGVDHPSDVVAGAITGLAVPAVVFRLLVPDEVVPVSYARGRRAHLDVGGRRRDAIAAALRGQMGLEVLAVEPFAWSGSAGSTPVRLTVGDASGREQLLFGKLYATVHLRSDRWYKLVRTIMYGRLEDERSFNTVRRLVEYEDHMLRVARDAGLPTAEPFGFVEITPEREYLLVTELLEGASPLGRDNVNDAVIDDGLRLVHRMWAAGLAHRDVKPANLLVRDDRIFLIDLAFAAIRPSPWRQAVDLANMMVSLAVFSTPERVYERACAFFTSDEIAEAFAASRGVTVPTQLRTLVKHDGRHVASTLRDLAPPRRPVAIQRWTMRRVGLTVGVVVGVLVGVSIVIDLLDAAGFL